MSNEIVDMQKFIHDQTQSIAKNYIIYRFKLVQMHYEGLESKKIDGLSYIMRDVKAMDTEDLMDSIRKFHPSCNRNILRIHTPAIHNRILNMLQKTIAKLDG